MSWYKTGNIAVTNGSAIIVGTGTAWVANVAAGEAIYCPDGKFYEIESINGDTSLTLAGNYTGTSLSGQSYTILPSQSFIRDLAAQAAALINNYASIANAAGAGKFGDGTIGAPGVTFVNDTDTGIRRTASGTFRLVANGVDIAEIGPNGLAPVTALILPGATSPAQTAEGSVVWDTDSNLLTVGDGASRKTMVDATSTQSLTNKTFDATSNVLLRVAIGSITLNGVDGVTLTHNKGDTSYLVKVSPTGLSVADAGEIAVVKSANTCVIYNSGRPRIAADYEISPL